MDLAAFREYCLSRSGASESAPFGEDTIVFKVGGKIFALASLDDVRILPATSVRIDGPAGERVQVDGDIAAALPLVVTIAERPFMLLR